MSTLRVYAEQFRRLGASGEVTLRLQHGSYAIGQRLVVKEVSQSSFIDTGRAVWAVVVKAESDGCAVCVTVRSVAGIA